MHPNKQPNKKTQDSHTCSNTYQIHTCTHQSTNMSASSNMDTSTLKLTVIWHTRAHTHTRTHSLSLSLSRTHTHTLAEAFGEDDDGFDNDASYQFRYAEGTSQQIKVSMCFFWIGFFGFGYCHIYCPFAVS